MQDAVHTRSEKPRVARRQPLVRDNFPTAALPIRERGRWEGFPSTQYSTSADVRAHPFFLGLLCRSHDAGDKYHCALLRGCPTTRPVQTSSDRTERDDWLLPEHREEPERWHPKTQSSSSQLFCSIRNHALNGLVTRNSSRWNFQKLLNIKLRLGQPHFPGRNQHQFLVAGTFRRQRN